MNVAIIVNPTKFDDLNAVRASAVEVTARLALPEARWYQTTEDDTGRGQTEEAIRDGADLVCSLGGDGTVRAVASALVGTDVPLGLLPGGTGNLLARNLGLPITDLNAALEVALTGENRSVDVGWVAFDDGEEELFLVMAGMGLDAEAVGADDTLKARIGVLAYVVSGVKALVRPGFRVTVCSDEDRCRQQHARMVVVGNCGELTGGVALLPDAVVDDGQLDAAVAAPRGVFGWVALLTDVITRHHRGHPRLQTFTAETFEVTTDRRVASEIDGDTVGDHRSLTARVEPGALRVRVAAPAA